MATPALSCLLLLFVLPQGGGSGGDDESAQEPEGESYYEILVTARGFAEDPLEAPFSTDARDDRFLRERSRTLPEALTGLPSVMVQKTSYGQSSPFIRGFTGFRNLMLVDGVRLNHSAFRDGPNQYWSTVDSLAVERLELVRGPSSVLYGSDAIGGTVNAIPRRAARGPEGAAFWYGGSFFGRYASAEDSFVWREELEVGHGADWAVLAGFSWKDFGDLEAGADTGTLPETGYEERDADVRFDRYLDSGLELTFAAQTARQIDVPRTHKTIFAVPYNGSDVGSELRREHDQIRDLFYGRARWADAGGLWDAGEITLSFHRHDEERDRLRDGGRRDLQGFEVNDVGLVARFESEGFGRWSWGFEAHHEIVDSFRSDFTNGVLTAEQIQGPVADDASYTTLAAYVQNEQQWEDFSFIPGVRFTHVSLDADQVANPGSGPPVLQVDEDWNALVGSLRGVRWLGEDSNLYAGLSQGFRAPNLFDVTSFEETSVVELPTLGLDPEYYVQAEVGTKGELEEWSWQAAAYRTWIRDMIVRSPTGAVNGSGTPIVRKDNVGDGWIHGIELALAWQLHQDWSTGVMGTWMDGEVDQLAEPAAVVVREPLSRVMPLQAYLYGRWEPAAGDYWVEGWAWMVDEQDELSLRDQADTSRIPPGGTPGYTILGVSGGWQFDPDWRATLSLENLGDKDYRVHGSGLNGPGRNIVLTLEARF